jgi:hypothetical protein
VWPKAAAALTPRSPNHPLNLLAGVNSVCMRLMDSQPAHRERNDSRHDESCSENHLSYGGPFRLIDPLDEFGVDAAIGHVAFSSVLLTNFASFDAFLN